jgi:hypothetical protein
MILSNRYLVVAATALALAGSAAAETEFLAVLERKAVFVAPPQQSGSGGCGTQDDGFEIVSFAEHAPKSTDNCDTGGKVMGKSGSLEGCKKGDYSNGFRVCGTKVNNDKGQHQQCEEDDTSVAKCRCSLFPVPWAFMEALWVNL